MPPLRGQNIVQTLNPRSVSPGDNPPTMTATGGRNTSNSARAAQAANNLPTQGNRIAQGNRNAQDDPNEMVKLKKSALEELKEKAKSLTRVSRELKASNKALGEKEEEIKGITKANEILAGNELQLKNTISKKDEVIAELKKKLDDMVKLLRKNGKVHESELNKELADKVKDTAKVYLFRTWKFVEDIEDLKAAAKRVIKYLPNKEADISPETEASFVDKYHLQVNEGLKLGRQYVQSEGRKVVDGT